MKAIIKNGVANKDIQSCFLSEQGIHSEEEIVSLIKNNQFLAKQFKMQQN